MRKFTEKRNLIKVILLLLSVVMFFCACTAQTDDTPVQTTPEASVSAESEKADDSRAVTDGETSTSQSTQKDGQKNSTSRAKSGETTAKTTTQSTQRKTTEKATAKATAKQSGTTAKQTNAPTAKTVKCTVTVECKKILSNKDKLKDGHEEYLPDGGVFFSNYTVVMPNGSSVYDAVKTACNENGVAINATNSQYGVYIVGFNNIDEKDCGNQSGWLYSVNGKTPGKSCGKYIITNGDNISFGYTC